MRLLEAQRGPEPPRFQRRRHGPDRAPHIAFVPVLWRYEVSNVLAGAVKAGKLSPQEAVEFIGDLGHCRASTGTWIRGRQYTPNLHLSCLRIA